MRIALVHPYSWPDVRRGGERYLHDLAWYLVGAGHDVHVFTGTHGDAGTEYDDGATVHRLPHLLPGRLEARGVAPIDTFGVAAVRELVRARVDVVHALAPSSALAARVARRPVVYTVLGHPTSDQFGRRPLDRKLVAAAVRFSTRPVALSLAAADAVERLFGRTVGVLSPGVRLDQFPAELAPRTGPPRLLFSADASDERKGIALLLDAMPGVVARHPDARLLLSGGGGDRLSSGPQSAVVDDLGAGALEHVPGRYRAATVTVLPARHEAFGLALVESLASGTPVVCTADGGMPEIVDDPGIGVVVPPGDTAALTAGICSAIELSRRSGTAARCRDHARRWDWATVVGPAHVATYRALVERSR